MYKGKYHKYKAKYLKLKELSNHNINNTNNINKTNTMDNIHRVSFYDPKDCPLTTYIIKGLKKVEGRVNSPKYKKIKTGDTIIFEAEKGTITCKVTYVKKYNNVRDYLENEGIYNALPCIDTIEEGVNFYKKFIDPSEIIELKEKDGHDFLGIGLMVIGNTISNMYHGSSEKRDLIKIFPSRLADVPVAFGITDKKVAASFIPEWSDDDFQHGNISENGKKNWYMKEQYKGAFNKLDVPGYIHTLEPDTFYRNDKLGLYEEYISNVELVPITVEYIENVREYIKGYFTLFKYDEEVQFDNDY